MHSKTIQEVFSAYRRKLMAMPGVVGTAIGRSDDKPCIKIYMENKSPELTQEIPDVLEGYKVVIEGTGEIRALPDD